MSASSTFVFSCSSSSSSSCSSSSSSSSSTSSSSTAGAAATSATTTTQKATRVQTNDPKTWPLGRYFWATILYALNNNKKPPTLEFYFDGVRSFTLRIDENQNQFLLCSHMESEVFSDPKTGEPLDVQSLADDELPCSRWDSLGFNTIVDDDEDGDHNEKDGRKGSLFACEIDGKQEGTTNVANAIEIVCKIYAECRKEKSVLDAVITRWNDGERAYESDRRYSDIDSEKSMAMHSRGTPHDSTVLYSQCGRNLLLMLRTMVRFRQSQCQAKKNAAEKKEETVK